jgi:hypothetical protein
MEINIVLSIQLIVCEIRLSMIHHFSYGNGLL